MYIESLKSYKITGLVEYFMHNESLCIIGGFLTMGLTVSIFLYCTNKHSNLNIYAQCILIGYDKTEILDDLASHLLCVMMENIKFHSKALEFLTTIWNH